MCRAAWSTLLMILGTIWSTSDHPLAGEKVNEWVKPGSTIYVSKNLTPPVVAGQYPASVAGQSLAGSYPHCTLMKVHAVSDRSLFVQDPTNSQRQIELGADWPLWVHRTENECHDAFFQRWGRSPGDG